MIDIAKKRLPLPVIYVFVYLSYCAASFFMMRGSMAYYSEYSGFASWFSNDVWAFFIGGMLPFGIYLFFTLMTLRMMSARMAGHGDVGAVRYGLCYAVIAANLVLFGIKFTFYAAPLYASMINSIIDPAVTLLFVGLYMWYAFKMNYVEKPLFRHVLTQVFGTFAMVYGTLSLLNVILVVAR